MGVSKQPITVSDTPAVVPAAAGVLQRACDCGGVAGSAGKCASCSAEEQLGVQPKLTIGPQDDAYEQEADRIADQVMAGAFVSSPLAAGVSHLQRQPVEEEEEMLQPKSERLQRQTEEEEEEEMVQAKTNTAATPGPGQSGAVPAATAVASGGQSLSRSERAYFEPRFGRDLSHVQLHVDSSAARAAAGIGARAYTLRNHIAFAAGQYNSGTTEGRRLMAHELTHTLQQSRAGAEPQPQRACTPTATCSGPSIPGSPEDFGRGEEAVEAGRRVRRRGMSAARARSSGHAGRAAQLETLLAAHSASQRALVHGIFIDADISSGTAAMIDGCKEWRKDSLPSSDPDPDGFATATKPCMFVPGPLNRQALRFNRGARTIDSLPRAEWHRETLLTLAHEAEHVRFDEQVEPGLSLPAAVSSASCTKAAVDDPLSEVVAIISEYPILFDAAAGESNPSGPLHRRLNEYFDDAVTQPGENFTGALTAIGCDCECPEVDEVVVQAVDAMTSAWSAAQKTLFRTEIQGRMLGPVGPSWPAAPTP